MRRAWGRPVNSTSRRSANEPKAPNRPTCGFEKAAWAMANTNGITTAALTERFDDQEIGILGAEPARPHSGAPEPGPELRSCSSRAGGRHGGDWTIPSPAATGRKPTPRSTHFWQLALRS